jgi:hypothetical protein
MTKKAMKRELDRIKKELADPLTVARHLAALLGPPPRYRP